MEKDDVYKETGLRRQPRERWIQDIVVWTRPVTNEATQQLLERDRITRKLLAHHVTDSLTADDTWPDLYLHKKSFVTRCLYSFVKDFQFSMFFLCLCIVRYIFILFSFAVCVAREMR